VPTSAVAAPFGVERSGVRLAGEELGNGPPVVLLHGLTATRRYVVMGSAALPRSGHRVISYDARGHGESSPAPEPTAYGYRDLTADLLAVLDQLGVERAVLVGASMGAHTALAAALEHPRRVAGLVVITPGYDPDTHDDPSSLARWDRLSAGLRDGGVEGFLAAYGEPEVPPAWRETVVRAIRQRLASHRHPEAVADALSAVPRSRPFASLDELEALDVPAIVVGSRDEADPGHPLVLAQAYSRVLRRARLAVEDAGHSPLAWQGGQVSRLAAEVAAAAWAGEGGPAGGPR
jgi:pimeloyl-ACP methyl ester carboxylesterase